MGIQGGALRITFKYFMVSFALMAAGLGAFCYLALHKEITLLEHETESKARVMADVIKNGLVTLMIEGRSPEFKHFIEETSAEDIHSITLSRPDGSVITSSGGTGKSPGPEVAVIRQEITASKPCQRCHDAALKVLALLEVSVLKSPTKDRIMATRRAVFLYGAGIALAVALLVSALVHYRISLPLSSVQATLSSAQAGDLDVRSGCGGRCGEAAEIAQSLDKLLGALRQESVRAEAMHAESLRRIEKMATVGEIASAVAHEIKNPLAGISGAIQVLSEEYKPGDQRAEIIKEVLKEIERLDRSVRQLMSYARPAELILMDTPVDSILERAANQIGQNAKKAHIDVNLLTAGTNITVHVDPDQMSQALYNIMLKSFGLMPAGGALNISCHPRPSRSEVEIAISDTGQGLLEQDLNNIFKPFFSIKHSTAGLGLALSKSIVERHGGRISVESQPGSGTLFRVVLPTTAAGAEAGDIHNA